MNNYKHLPQNSYHIPNIWLVSYPSYPHSFRQGPPRLARRLRKGRRSREERAASGTLKYGTQGLLRNVAQLPGGKAIVYAKLTKKARWILWWNR